MNKDQDARALITDRRPGLQQIINEVQAKHPKWSLFRCRCTAKQIWTDRHYAAKGGAA